MTRSLRSKKPSLRYSEQEYELGTAARKKSTEKQREPSVQGSGIKTTKGNLSSNRSNAKETCSAVLRDRTNLPAERLKVDLLMKKGARDDGGKAKRSARAVRATTGSATAVKKRTDNVEPENIAAEVRKKFGKVEINDETSSRGATRVGTTKVVKTLRKKSETSELSDKEEMRKMNTRMTRKAPRKVIERETLSEKSSKYAAVSDKVAKSKDQKSVSTKAKKLTRSTRRGLESIEATRKSKDTEVAKRSPAERMRKISRKISDEKDTSGDSGLGAKDSPEQDAVSESENTAGIASRLAARRTVRRVARSRQSTAIPADPSSRRVSIKAGKKFFKNKATDEATRSISPVKLLGVDARRRKIGIRGNPRASVSFRSRQLTLGESFAKQASRKVLRPRKAAKNYCEVTMVGQKVATGRENDGERHVPVYKTIEPQENSVNDKSEIYEFKFDSNDSREKLPKKRKRRVVGIKRAKNREGTRKKVTTLAQVDADARSNDARPTRPRESKNNKNPVVESDSAKANEAKISSTPMDTVPAASELIEEPEVSPSEERSATVVNPDAAAKPRILESIELRGNERVSLTTTPIHGKSSDGKLRHVLQPSKQYRTMLSHALLNKSLSPITKAIESFDPGSPWRPPTFASQEFSRVKNVVQSTPQVRNFSAMLETTTSRVDAVTTRRPKTNVTEADARSSHAEKELPDKAIGKVECSRKFGTVISNVNNTPTGIFARTSETKATKEREPNAVPLAAGTGVERIDEMNANENESAITSSRTETASFSSHVDKENSLPSCPSTARSPLKALNIPKKSPIKSLSISPLKRLNKLSLKSLNVLPRKNTSKSPLKSRNDKSNSLEKSSLERPSPMVFEIATTEVASNSETPEPRAGPSNAPSTLSFSNASRVLRQSNLNNFLNLDEMPASTRISTAHGIFDDAHSTPISGKPVRKVAKDPNVENAFGFDEDDSDSAISPIGKPINDRRVAMRHLQRRDENGREDKNMPKTARLSIGDIKRHLLPIMKTIKVKEQPIVERIEAEEKENRNDYEEIHTGKKQLKDAIDFVDTFDVNAEKDVHQDTQGSSKEVPLFADLEPKHFKEAPRYSYKRKRAVGFVLSEDEDQADHDGDEYEDSPTDKHRFAKKRKTSKVEKKRQEQLENWAKSLNRTFEEIDHFHLVVE